MTDALKRYNTPCGHGLQEHPQGLAYHKDEVDAYIAGLSADLVRAALEAAAAQWIETKVEGGHALAALEAMNSRIKALSADPEAIAAIVARVTEGK